MSPSIQPLSGYIPAGGDRMGMIHAAEYNHRKLAGRNVSFGVEKNIPSSMSGSKTTIFYTLAAVGILSLLGLLWGIYANRTPESDPGTDPPTGVTASSTDSGVGENDRVISIPRFDLDQLGIDDKAIVRLIRNTRNQLRRQPSDADHWRAMGMVLHRHLQYDLARQMYEGAIALDNGDVRSFFYLAFTRDRVGDRPGAIEAMARAAALSENLAAPHWRNALWLMEEGDLNSAEQAVDRALKIEPDNKYARLVSARITLQQDRAADAAAILEKLIELNPRDRYTRFLLGTAYRELGRSDDAEKQLHLGQGGEPMWRDRWSDELNEIHVGFRAEFLQAMKLMNNGQVETALSQFQSLRLRKPNDIVVLLNLSIAYRRLERLDEAIAQLSKILAKHPDTMMAHFHLAAVYRQQYIGQDQNNSVDQSLLDMALVHIDRVIELNPTFAEGYALRGEILGLKKMPRESAQAYLEALNFEPHAALWAFQAGLMLCEVRAWEQAIAFLEHAVKEDDTSADAWFLLGAALVNHGQNDKAREALLRAKLLRPDDPNIRSALEQLSNP